MPCFVSASAVLGPIAAIFAPENARASSPRAPSTSKNAVDAVAAGEHDPRVGLVFRSTAPPRRAGSSGGSTAIVGARTGSAPASHNRLARSSLACPAA